MENFNTELDIIQETDLYKQINSLKSKITSLENQINSLKTQMAELKK